MHAAVIAAGEGTRLSPYFGGIPKPLVPIDGRPIIDWLFDQLRVVGFSTISVVIRTDHQRLIEHLNRKDSDIKLNIVCRNTEGGMHSLFALRPYLEKESDFFLFTVDNIFDPNDLASFVRDKEKFTARTLTTWITRRPENSKDDIGVNMDDNLMILDVGKHLKMTPLVAEGPFHCKSRIFEAREEAQRTHINRLSEYIRFLLARGHAMYGYPVSKVFDIDHITDHDLASQFLRSLRQDK